MEAAAAAAAECGGWPATAAPEFRKQVVERMTNKLALLRRGGQQACFQFASSFEFKMLNQTHSMDEYLRRISSNIAQMQIIGHQQLPAHPVQAAQVSNSCVPEMPQAASNMVTPQLQGMANVKQQQSKSMPMPEHTLNSQQGAITQSALINECRNQPGQRVVQSEVTQSQAQCNPARGMLQNAATVGQNAQQIQMQMQSPQMHGAHQNNVVRMQHSDHPGVQNNHEQIKMSPPQKPMTLPPLQTAADQQSNSPSINPQTPTMIESVGEVDWREKLFQSITTLKAAHFSELMDLDKTMIQRKLTDDELQSLPEKEAKSYKFREKVKTKTMTALNFLQIQKSHIDEHTEEKFHRQENTIKFLISLHRERNDKIAGMIGSRQSQECHDLRQLLQTPNHPTDDPSQSSPPNPSRDQRDDEQEKTEETSISQSVHNYNCDDTTTPSIDSVPQQNNTNNDNLAGQSEDEAAVVPKKRPIDHLIDSDAAAAAAQSPAMEVQQIDTACFMCLEQRPYYDHHLLNGEFKPQKRQKTDNNDSPLQREIDAINDKLIDTVITIVTDDVVGKEDDETKKTHPKAKPTTIKFRYTAVSVSPEVRQLLTSSAGSSLVKEMKLSVPADYPQSSPVIVEYEQPQGGRYGEIAQAVEAAFRRALGELPQPMSIEQMARAWDAAVRGVVTEIAQRDGGGTFSSEYGEWESCE